MLKVSATFFVFFGATQGFIKLWLDGVVLFLEGFHGLGSIGWVIRGTGIGWAHFVSPWLEGVGIEGASINIFKVYFANIYIYIYIYILPPFTLYIYTRIHTQTPFDVLMSHFFFFLISTNTILFFIFLFLQTYIYIYIYIDTHTQSPFYFFRTQSDDELKYNEKIEI